MSEIQLSSRMERAKHSLKQNEYLNLPDLQFFNWCNQQYNINRGVYNTVDQWFYDNGLKEILPRRLYILSFLRFVLDKELVSGPQKFIRFGNGGLVKQITEFIKIKDNESEKPSLYLYST
jgi:riboflavin kinase